MQGNVTSYSLRRLRLMPVMRPPGMAPEGNLLLLISLDGAPTVGRMGLVQQASTGAAMTFRSFDSLPSFGSAWTLSAAGTISIRSLLSSS